MADQFAKASLGETPDVESLNHEVKGIKIEGGQFIFEGKPLVIRSGEIHYPRVPREYWRDRMLKLKQMGLNTVSTYVFWNLHQPTKDRFDFSEQLDLAAFVRTAQELGLWVILRPGPYICAEWDFGGLPSWLLKDIKQVRSRDPLFLSEATAYLKKVNAEVAPLFLENGGPIIMTQVENEYGSFGQDKFYLQSVYQAYQQAGFTGFLYTADSVWGRFNVQRELSNGSLPNTYAAINFGQTSYPGSAFAEAEKFRPGQPKMSGEYWVGWFDHVGGPHAVTDVKEAANGLAWMVKNGISFNLYMFHGGTNFGFMNGANWDRGRYMPDTTSYDYDAPLDEAGRPTAKYDAFREILKNFVPPLAADETPRTTPSLLTFSPVFLSESAPLEQLLVQPFKAKTTLTMEELDQAYGYVLYRHLPKKNLQGVLSINELHDYAVVSQDGKMLGTLDRRIPSNSLGVNLEANHPLEILVENMGRINFSRMLTSERKGITQNVKVNAETLQDWEMFSLPFDQQIRQIQSLRYQQGMTDGPAFYRGFIALSKVGDTFLTLEGFKKGVVFVNGRILGRYWEIGPQKSLYCPASWLNEGRNEVIVFDLLALKTVKKSIAGVANPIYTSSFGKVPNIHNAWILEKTQSY